MNHQTELPAIVRGGNLLRAGRENHWRGQRGRRPARRAGSGRICRRPVCRHQHRCRRAAAAVRRRSRFISKTSCCAGWAPAAIPTAPGRWPRNNFPRSNPPAKAPAWCSFWPGWAAARAAASVRCWPGPRARPARWRWRLSPCRSNARATAGRRRRGQSLEQLKSAADGVICLPSQRIFKLVDLNTDALEIFRVVDGFLLEGVRGVWHLLTRPGLIQVHFGDLCALLRDRHAENAFAFVEARRRGPRARSRGESPLPSAAGRRPRAGGIRAPCW